MLRREERRCRSQPQPILVVDRDDEAALARKLEPVEIRSARLSVSGLLLWSSRIADSDGASRSLCSRHPWRPDRQGKSSVPLVEGAYAQLTTITVTLM